MGGNSSLAALAASEAAADQRSPVDEAGGVTQACPYRTHWVELELLDERGQPVADQRFVVVLPDGTRHGGKTDAQGIGRVKGFKADGGATCKVLFPDLDDGAWERAST
jgi:hypothetical protein